MSEVKDMSDMTDIDALASAHAGAKLVFNARQTLRARELLARLSGARRAVRFYPQGHVAVHDNVSGLMSVIREFHQEGVDVPLIFFENEVLLGEQLLATESVMFDQLIRDMSSAGRTSVCFRRGLAMEELDRAMAVLSADAAGLEAAGGVQAAVEAADIPHVEIGTVALARHAVETEHTEGTKADPTHTKALDVMRDYERQLGEGRVPPAADAIDVVKDIVDSVLSDRDTMLGMAVLKHYDEYTFFHSVNVAILSVALGSRVSSSPRFLNSLGVGALLHDIGKMTVGLDVLNKSGRLTADEWDLMRMHPLRGAEVASAMHGLDRSAIVVILEHHMRYDLDGYPEREPRRPQQLTSRITAISDSYDAMTSRRTYSFAHLPDEAMEVLSRNAGTSFDPMLVRMFTQMIGVYPPRSVVRLSSGEVGVVVRNGSDMLAPTVRIITDASATLIDPVDVELSDPVSADGRRVESCLDPEALNIDVDDYVPELPTKPARPES